MLIARIAAGVAVCVAGYFGINPPGFVAQVVAFAFGLAAASFFPAIILGIFSRRMNKEGAISGMIVGITFTAAYIKLLQIHASGAEQRGALVVGHITGGHRHGWDALEFCNRFDGEQVYAKAAAQGCGNGGPSPNPSRRRQIS